MKTSIEEIELSERDLFVGRFEREGFHNIMESDHEDGLEDKRNPHFALLYKYEKNKNYFVFVTIKRDFPCRNICDISSQMLVLERHKQPKMVARNKFFDAGDDIGNVVHVEFENFDEPVEVMNQVLRRLR